jgi:putative flippase GtrA
MLCSRGLHHYTSPMRITLNNHSADSLSVVAIRLGRFLAVGVAGLATDTLIYMALYRNGVPSALARGISLSVATLVTWLLNRRLTFDRTRRHALQEAVRYASVALVAQGINYGLFLATVSAIPGIFHPLAILFSSACATVFSFTGQYMFTFLPVTVASRGRDAGRVGQVAPAAAARSVQKFPA